MIYLRLALVILLVFFSIFFSVHAQQQTLNIVYLENGLKDLNKVDKLVALNLLAKEFIKDSDSDTSLVAVNSIEEMIDSIKQGKVHYGILNSYYYLAYSEQLKPFMGVRTYGRFSEALKKKKIMCWLSIRKLII